MNDQIQIKAEIITEDTCQFNVDRQVYEDGSVYFASKEEAVGSPLAEKLFEIPQVTGVLVSYNMVKVTKEGYDDWLPMAKQIGSIIRSQLQSGEPAISEKIKSNLPSPEKIRERVESLINEQINPAIAAHGGFVQLIDVKKNDVFLQLGGGCQGCGMANVTLRQGIERMIRQVVPQVGNILDITDHAAGTNPYYSR